MNPPTSDIPHRTSDLGPRPPAPGPRPSALRSLLSALRPVFFALFAFFAVSSSAFAQAAPEPPAPIDPPELLELRAKHEQRRELALRPFRDQHVRQLEALIQRYIQLGRANDALAIQRYADAFRRGAALPAEAESDPPDLKAARNQYATQSANAARPARDWYRFQLPPLQRRYAAAGDLAAAGAVERELAALEDAPAAPTAPARFDWRKERRGVTYEYSSDNFARGGYDYSDRDCRRLLDGTVEKSISNGVGWTAVPDPAIFVAFERPVRPTVFRMAVLHLETANVSAPAAIVVRDGSSRRRGALLGELKTIPPKSGWVEVPLDMNSPSQTFRIELQPTPSSFLLIEEMEFE